MQDNRHWALEIHMAPQTCVLNARRPALVTLGHPNDVCLVRKVWTIRDVVGVAADLAGRRISRPTSNRPGRLGAG
eukprot:9340655-Alexandrium_andersonii.AAC.1